MPTQMEENVEERFAQIVSALDVIEADERTRPDDDRITVLLDLPHLADFGHSTTNEFTYGCRFPVKEGDVVECPPTPRGKGWTRGIVTALHANGYRGPVKYVRQIKE
jgi:hypothetical protein